MAKIGANQPRAGRGRFVRTPETAERDAKACALRAEGLTYDAVAKQMGYADPATARNAVQRALMAIVEPSAARLRTLELARLDLLLGKAWSVLKAEHIVVSQGRVMGDPRTGEPMVDHGPVLQAIATVLKIMERRAKLMGLDAPVKVEAITVDQIDAEVARLAAEMGMVDERPQVP